MYIASHTPATPCTSAHGWYKPSPTSLCARCPESQGLSHVYLVIGLLIQCGLVAYTVKSALAAAEAYAEAFRLARLGAGARCCGARGRGW